MTTGIILAVLLILSIVAAVVATYRKPKPTERELWELVRERQREIGE